MNVPSKLNKWNLALVPPEREIARNVRAALSAGEVAKAGEIVMVDAPEDTVASAITMYTCSIPATVNVSPS